MKVSYKYILIGILILAGFLRLYQIDQYMTFLGDEGRDSIIVKRLLIEGDIPFIGPTTSVGNVYSGPLYYYMMAVSMVGTIDPVAAAVMNALIGTATVFLIFWFTKKLFDTQSGLTASFLYALSPVNIIYSRSSWNPNPVPFFTLLSFIVFYQFHKTKNIKWMFVLGVLLGSVIQMHFISLILVVIFMVLTFFEWRVEKVSLKTIIKGRSLAFLGFLLMQIPWLLFELKHGFINSKGIWNLFFGEHQAVGGDVNIFTKFFEVFVFNLVGRYMLPNNIVLSFLIVLLLVIALVKGYRRYKEKRWEYIMLTTWLFVGILGVSFYKGSVYDHYLGFVAPVIFIIWGVGLFSIRNNNTVPKIIQKMGLLSYGVLSLVVVYAFISSSPLLLVPNNQLQRTKDIAKYVISETGGGDFNFALLSKNNYDSAYQFYFDIYGHIPKVVPVQRTQQLFVVCEDNECNPINNPKYEIAAFGMSKIESVKDFQGIKVYRLIANPSGKPG